MCGPGLPKVTFGVIVLNGEPFTRYCLRGLYPFAHEIIVVEGSVAAAANIATPDGHSTDGTLESLYRFKAEEDPQDKVQIVVRDGFWDEKDAQSQAYACRASGDYLWQVDIDEFYKPEDIRTVLGMLQDDSRITAVSFKQISFWGGFDYIVDGWNHRRGAEIYHRLFKWGSGYRYITHRPPTVQDSRGRNLRRLKYISGHRLANRGIRLYHYCLLLPKQVIEKSEYYGNAAWFRRPKARQWAEDVFLGLREPYRVHNVYEYLSWLERFTGSHPPQVEAMRADLEAGKVGVDLRPTDDIERLLESRSYKLGRAGLKLVEPLNRIWRGSWRRGPHYLRRVISDPLGSAALLRRKAERYVDRRM